MGVVSGVPPEEHDRVVGYFEHLPRIAAIIALLIGAMVLIGWALGNPMVIAIDSGAKMVPSTAVCFVLAGLGLGAILQQNLSLPGAESDGDAADGAGLAVGTMIASRLSTRYWWKWTDSIRRKVSS